MRVFHITPTTVQETAQLPQYLPEQGFIWLSLSRPEFEAVEHDTQTSLERLCRAPLVHLHVRDVLNEQLPSHYDYTSDYNLMVFRRLAAGHSQANTTLRTDALLGARDKGGPPVLHRIDTSPVAFVVYDRLLLTVHPADCLVRDSFATRLLTWASAANSTMLQRMPLSPPDLMLRIISQMVDGYLNLRRELTRQLDHWQAELINPNTRFKNWGALLDARLDLHHLDEICEDQRAALQDWIDALDMLTHEHHAQPRALELLKIRSRDVLEHIERVVHHVRRLEQSTETAVQMHFNVQSNRTNDIMRTLTVLTAIFLPLNLITGFFGMNFENFPALHNKNALWWTLLLMCAMGAGSMVFFWRKRYLGRNS